MTHPNYLTTDAVALMLTVVLAARYACDSGQCRSDLLQATVLRKDIEASSGLLGDPGQSSDKEGAQHPARNAKQPEV